MKCVAVSTTHQTETGTLLRQNAHDTKKYELKDKNINIWLCCHSFFFSFFLMIEKSLLCNHVFLKEIIL